MRNFLDNFSFIFPSPNKIVGRVREGGSACFSTGQVLLEFTFCMIIVFLMMYGLFMVFRWTGIDLAGRRKAHDALLTTSVHRSYSPSCIESHQYTESDGDVVTVCDRLSDTISKSDGPLKQIEPFFYKPAKINAVWGEAVGRGDGFFN